jgi:RNA polymerase subunit RPABC4/transcription elongation factor Spt4
MNACQNCGKLNSGETNFCRFCGTKFVFQKPVMDHSQPYDYPAPRPYAWKTDEFQTQTDSRKTVDTNLLDAPKNPIGDPARQFQPGPLVYQPMHMSPPFRCPHCMSQYLPRVERRISTGGWITFAVLLVAFFPLFWIGLLIKEDVKICQSCNNKVSY